MWYWISGLPRTCSSGLGQVSVSGRMRSPRPAARIIAWAPLMKAAGNVGSFAIPPVERALFGPLRLEAVDQRRHQAARLRGMVLGEITDIDVQRDSALL